MSLWAAILLIVVGVALVIAFSGRLVRGAVGTSYGFGVSASLTSIIFLGFDPENLAVGGAGAYEQIAGIALGSILGAGMVALALAFGITTLFAPMTFENAPKPVLGVSVAVSLLMLRKRIGRGAGALLVLLYGLFVAGGYFASETEALGVFQ